MVEFRFRLGLLVRNWLLISGLVLAAGALVPMLISRSLHVDYGTLAVLGSVLLGGLGLNVVSQNPPVLIQIDQAEGTVRFVRLLSRGSTVLNYQHVRSEFATKRRGTSVIRGWSLTYAGKEQLFVELHHSGWTEASLQAVHEHLRPLLP